MPDPMTMNPFGVGKGNQPDCEHTGKCRCCDWPMIWVQPPALPRQHWYCEDCVGHFRQDGETMERRLERSEAHLLAADRWAHDYRDAAATANQKLQAHLAKVYPPEGPWQFVVEAVARRHRPGLSDECLCGARLPCPTIQDMKQVDEYEVQRLLDRVWRRADRAGEDPRAWMRA